MLPTVSVTESLPVRTQFLIFTLFGEYLMDRGGKIWTSSLLDLMALIGVSERAVRSTLSRMSQKGWIRSQKHGRRSQYTITARGRALLEAGQQRIFEPIFTDWDHQWHIVVYSLPEKKRRKRHALRRQLSWLGFGHLAPGTWFSPHDRRAELKALFSDLEVEPYVDLFCGLYLGPSTAKELIQRSWDLAGLKAQYRDFIKKYDSEYRECLNRANGQQPPDAKSCFVRRFWLTHDFQSFPLTDPNLPTVLLPVDWIGFQARELFDKYHELLVTHADDFVDEVMSGDESP